MDDFKIRFGDEICTKEKTNSRRLEGMFHSLNPMFSLGRPAWKPRVDTSERGNEVRGHGALSGVDEKNMAVESCSRVVTSFGNRKTGEAGPGAPPFRRRSLTAPFKRLLHQPCAVCIGSAKATFVRGLLTLHLVKSTSGEV